MDKKLKFSGGEPDINWDDLDRDETANRLALFGLFADFNYGPNDNFIISGCVATLDPGVDVDVTAGYIFLNGEILKVDAQTVVDGGTADLYKYVKSTTYETGGNKTFNDGTPRQTWQKNRGIVTAATTPILTTELDVTDGDHFRNGAWQTPPMSNGWQLSGDGFQYRIGIGGRLEFRGGLNPVIATSPPIFTLPVGYRPATAKRDQAIIMDAVEPSVLINLNISTGGVVTVDNTVTNTVINFDNITLPLD